MVRCKISKGRMLCRAGAEGKPTMFLFSDSQIKQEAFVEDLNTLLNTGEVPNLFPYDERAAITEAVRPAAVKASCPAESSADLWNFFVDRTKANLHIVLAFSPVGDAFRCCTIGTSSPDLQSAWICMRSRNIHMLMNAVAFHHA
jgi:P-loop containing dynein motor region D4